MVKANRGLLALLVVVLAAAIWFFFLRGDDAAVAVATTTAPAPPKQDVAWIGVKRLKAENPVVTLGKRNIFEYRQTPPPTPPPTAMPVEALYTPPPTPIGPPPTPIPPPINLKFMGVIKVQDGSRVAVLQTEQKEILHGRQGDTLAGRYKIVEIKLESVDIQDVTSGSKQTLRIGGR